MCFALLDIMIINPLMISMAVMDVIFIMVVMAITAVMTIIAGCNTRCNHNDSNGYNGSDYHNECNGFIIYEFCYLSYITHNNCYKYGHYFLQWP